MRFYEKLNELIATRGIRSQEICEATGIKKAYLSKLRKGTLFPPNWSEPHRIARFLQLSDDEYAALRESWKAERLSPEMLAADQAMHRIYACSPEQPPAFCFSALEQKPAGGSLLRGEQLQNVAGTLLTAAEQVRLAGVPHDGALQEWLYDLLCAAKKPVKWLMQIEKAEQSAANVCTLADAMPLLLHAQTDVRMHDRVFADMLFPILLFADADLILLSEDGTQGIFLTGGAAEAYADFFEQGFAEGNANLAVFHDMVACLKSLGQLMIPPEDGKKCRELHLFMKYPCTLTSVSKTEIHAHLQDLTLPGDWIAQQYYRFLCVSSNDETVIYNCFSEEGLQAFLTAEEYHEFSKTLTKSVSKELRHQLFAGLIEEALVKESVLLELIYDRFAYDTVFCGMNLWEDGRLIFVIDSKTHPIVMILREPGTVHAMIAWLNALRHCGIISTKETALAVCRQALEACTGGNSL